MTIAELANVAQVSQRTVRRVVDSLYPSKMNHGKSTAFSREEATAIMAKLRKPGFVSPINSGKMPESVRQNAEVKKLQLSGALVKELRLTMGNEKATAFLFGVAGVELPGRVAVAPVQGQLALEPPKPPRASLLSEKYPISDVYEVSILIGRPPSWIEDKSRFLDLHIGEWDLEDCYRLLCSREGVTPQAMRVLLAREREKAIREHIAKIEAAS